MYTEFLYFSNIEIGNFDTFWDLCPFSKVYIRDNKMESLFINDKISECALERKYLKVRRIGIQKIIAFLECIKHHPRKYELLQALRPVFSSIFKFYESTSDFVVMERILNEACDKYIVLSNFKIKKIFMNIAFISKESKEWKNGLILFKNFKESTFYNSKFSYEEEFDFYWKVSKYGNIGNILNTL